MNAGLNYNNGFTYNSDTGTYFAAYSASGVGEIVEFATLEDMANFTNPLQNVEMNGPDWDNGIEYDSVNNLWCGAFSGGTTVPGGVSAFSSLADLATASNPVSTTRYSSNVTDYEMGLAIVPCFTSGTLIETPTGPVAVENLSKGDLVLTCDNGPQPVRWTGSRKLTAQDLETSPNLRPIRIHASALGKNLPEQDLTVSPQHRVLVRSKIAQRMFSADEVLVAAKHLLEIDGIEIAEDVTQVEYFHILFDRHEVVFSNGAETESLYTGPQALKSFGQAARDEIFTLFPELREQDSVDGRQSARALISGRMGRQLALRHNKNHHELVEPM
ncbi:Hint domain-containing protein [Paracoccus saliphilus]|nr:Hint domain-containing protein [Paracoccus saliphilus]